MPPYHILVELEETPLPSKEFELLLAPHSRFSDLPPALNSDAARALRTSCVTPRHNTHEKLVKLLRLMAITIDFSILRKNTADGTGS